MTTLGYAEFNTYLSEEGGRLEEKRSIERFVKIFEEAEFLQRLPSEEGTIFLAPSVFFDEEELPDIDPSCVRVADEQGCDGYAVPLSGFRGSGLQIIAPEHLASHWAVQSQERLQWEFEQRRERNLPVPPIVQQFSGENSEVSYRG